MVEQTPNTELLQSIGEWDTAWLLMLNNVELIKGDGWKNGLLLDKYETKMSETTPT